MTPEYVIEIILTALKTGVLIVAPMLIFGLVAGVIVSMFQAATSIQEMTLVFIPKILAVILALVIFFPWILQIMIDFTRNLFVSIGTIL
jgi:flagellar biosynthetic protein FliQ